MRGKVRRKPWKGVYELLAVHDQRITRESGSGSQVNGRRLVAKNEPQWSLFCPPPVTRDLPGFKFGCRLLTPRFLGAGALPG